jgi:hypothetical protein
MNGSAERARAYLKVFIKSCETVLQGGDARSSARVAVFAELVGIAGATTSTAGSSTSTS